eukprot:11161783-Prorocentrum_lima.AAC.1
MGIGWTSIRHWLGIGRTVIVYWLGTGSTFVGLDLGLDAGWTRVGHQLDIIVHRWTLRHLLDSGWAL